MHVRRLPGNRLSRMDSRHQVRGSRNDCVLRRAQECRGKRKLAGWVARTRSLSGPLSPRGPQPVLGTLRGRFAWLNGSAEPAYRVPGLYYKTVISASLTFAVRLLIYLVSAAYMATSDLLAGQRLGSTIFDLSRSLAG